MLWIKNRKKQKEKKKEKKEKEKSTCSESYFSDSYQKKKVIFLIGR